VKEERKEEKERYDGVYLTYPNAKRERSRWENQGD
jgi:hypothetical protein